MGMHDPEHICLSCGHVAPPADLISGNFIGEASLWIVAIVIASISTWYVLLGPLAYSIYRFSSKKQGCSLCKSEQIIPINSPNGKALIDKNKAQTTEPV